MAISASTVWEVRTTGASTNGGGYVSGGTDYSLQDSPQLALTDIAIADGTTTTITSATGGFTAAMVGNIIYLTGGSGGTLTTQRRQISTYVDTNTITVDQAPAPTAGMTGVTGNIGGALSGPWDVHSVTVGSDAFVIGNTMFIKSGTYVRTSSWYSKIQGAGTLTNPVNIVGYDTNRDIYNTDSNRPVITTSTNSTLLFYQAQMSGVTAIKNLVFSNTASIRSSGVGGNTGGGGSSETWWINCRFTGFTDAFLGGASSPSQAAPICINCEIDNCSGNAIDTGTFTNLGYFFYNCYIHNNNTGLYYRSNNYWPTMINCLIVDNVYGIRAATSARNSIGFFKNCTIANNTTAQIQEGASSTLGVNSPFLLINCLIYGGNYCISNLNNLVSFSKSIGSRYVSPNAIGGASISNLLNIESVNSDIIITEDPFIDSANGDYRLNDKPGGGRLCKNSGYVKNFVGLSDMRNGSDIGFFQSQLKTISN